MALNMQPYLILSASTKTESAADAAALASANKFQASAPDDLCFVFYINMKHNKIGVGFSDKFYPYAQRAGVTNPVLTMNFNDLIAQQVEQSADGLIKRVLEQLPAQQSTSEIVQQVLTQLPSQQMPVPVDTGQVVKQVLKSLPHPLSVDEVSRQVLSVLQKMPPLMVVNSATGDVRLSATEATASDAAGGDIATDASAGAMAVCGDGLSERQCDVVARQAAALSRPANLR